MIIRAAGLAATLLATTTPAIAAQTDSAIDGVELAAAGQTIIVTGQRGQYGVRATGTATKTDTAVKDIPQALTVVSEQQIADQQLRSVADLLYFVPGAGPGSGEGNRDQITLRGNSSTADFFVDGVRDDVQYFRDFYNVDRVEVLRGPNAMIFGRGGGGGIVNRVTKRASLDQRREFAVSADSEGGVRATADIDEPLAPNIGLRINAMAEDGDSFRKHVDLKRYGVNPTLAVLAGPDTRIDLGYEHFHDRRTADRGVPSFEGEPIRGFDSIFFGDPDKSFAKADVDVGTLAVQHDLGGGVTLRNRTLLGSYRKFYQNVYPRRVDGDEVELGAYNNATDRTNLFNQTDLIWKNAVGGIDQTLLLGVEFGRQTSRNVRMTGVFAGGDNRVPLSDPTVAADVDFQPVGSDADNHTRATVAAIYAQDQIRLSPFVEIVAGVRFDRFEIEVDDHRVGESFRRVDDLVSPRIGLILKPRPNLSLYASYSRSYLPQSGDQFSRLDEDSASLKPERFDNYEVGAKWEPVPGLLATAAIYQLDRTNTRAADPADPSRIVLTGAQRSRGLELGLERSITSRWQVSAGYAWQKAEIVETTAAAPEGREVPLVPRHSFSVWSRYDVSPKLGLGLGVTARSKSFASISNEVVLPGYARVDAAAFYTIAHGVEAQVNVENLFGADYFPTTNGDNNIAPGAPTTARATLRFTF